MKGRLTPECNWIGAENAVCLLDCERGISSRDESRSYWTGDTAWTGLRSTDQRYPGDNRLILPESSNRRECLAPQQNIGANQEAKIHWYCWYYWLRLVLLVLLVLLVVLLFLVWMKAKCKEKNTTILHLQEIHTYVNKTEVKRTKHFCKQHIKKDVLPQRLNAFSLVLQHVKS